MDPADIFSPAELARYARHFAIPSFGPESQLRLKSARVLVVGAGGLGSPLLLYLAAAGVGHLGIVDFDTVEDSNLQRQVLYTTADLGKPKAQTARQKLLALNPHIEVSVYPEALTRENALEIIAEYDIVADGTDNFPTRYLVNDACVLTGKVNVYASIFRFEGQVSVFNLPMENGERGPNYRDLFPQPPPPGQVPNCAEGGVLGVLPGIIGSLQANEVIKVITGIGDSLNGRLFLFDAAAFSTRILRFKARPETQITGLIDYEQFCGLPELSLPSGVKELSPAGFQELVQTGADFQLIDVREPYEYAIRNLEGTLIPLDQIEAQTHRIATDKKVVIYCQSGKRSITAIQILEKRGFTNLYNLTGGILAWEKTFGKMEKQP